MAPFDYLLVLASVVLGLSLCEITIGVHRLLNAWGRIDWDWLVPLAATVVFLKIVTQWWSWHAAVHLAAGITFEMFIGVLLGAMLLFLLAATPLPEPAEGEPVDLRAHYLRIAPRYWILFALQWTVATATSLWVQVSVEHLHLSLLSPVFLLPVVAVALAFTRRPRVHLLCLLGFVALYLAQGLGHALV